MTIRPNAIEMKPRSAPENGAFVPPSSRRIAGTEPAPTNTRSAVPIASANARCATEKVSITRLLPAFGRGGRGPFRGFPRASSLGNDIRHCRTSFGERMTSRTRLSRALSAAGARRNGKPSGGAPRTLALTALLAQLVEHLHGKEGVDGSSPLEGSRKAPQSRGFSCPSSCASCSVLGHGAVSGALRLQVFERRHGQVH